MRTPGMDFHKLEGDLAAFHAVTVQRRIGALFLNLMDMMLNWLIMLIIIRS